MGPQCGGSYLANMRLLSCAMCALALSGCALFEDAKEAVKPKDPTAALTEAVRACHLYTMTPEIPRDAALDQLCESLLGQCGEPAE